MCVEVAITGGSMARRTGVDGNLPCMPKNDWERVRNRDTGKKELVKRVLDGPLPRIENGADDPETERQKQRWERQRMGRKAHKATNKATKRVEARLAAQREYEMKQQRKFDLE